MRETKFRGLRIDGRGWVYGDLVQTNQFTYILSTSFIPVISLPSDYFTEVDEKTVGQFTGLTDKNGTEVYEGDVLKCKGNIVTNKEEIKPTDSEDIFDIGTLPEYKVAYFNNEVQWFEGVHHGYRFKRGRFTCPLKQSTIHNMEAIIIGNIHQNPELLES